MKKQQFNTSLHKISQFFHILPMICVASLTAFATTSHADDEPMELIIEKVAPRSNVQIAIVPFAGAESISNIISNDLTNLGKFALDNNLPERPHSSGEVTLPVWQHKSVPYLVVGNSRTNSRGEVEINFEVIEVASGKILQGVHTEKAKNTQQSLRMAGHKVADKIYEILTGIKGDFSGKIAYVVESGVGKNKTSRLIVSDVDGYNPTVLKQIKGTISSLTPSPDGKRIAYTAQTVGYPVIFVADVTTKSSNILTPFRANSFSASFSPDGSRILFSSDKDGNPEIYVSSATGGSTQRLTNHPMADFAPSWSPDGKSFLFTSDRLGNNQPQVYRQTFGSGSPQRITKSGNYNSNGRFNSDGTKMTFLSGTQQGAVMDLRTGAVSSVNNVGLSEAPNFSPNGQHLIYSGRNVITISSNGKAVSINPSQNGVAKGTIREPIWLKATN